MIKLRFWIFALLVVVLVGVNFHFTSREQYRSAAGWADAVLSQAAHRLDQATAAATGSEVTLVRRVATAAPVRGALAGAVQEGAAPSAATAMWARTAAGTEEAPTLVLLVAPGGAMGQTGAEEEPEVWAEIPTWPALEAALAGQPAAGVGVVPGLGLMQLAAAPVEVPQGVAAVVLGWPMETGLARSVAQALGVEVAYLDEEALASASTPPIRHQTLAREAAAATPGQVFGWGRDETLTLVTLSEPLTGVAPVAAFGKRLAGAEDVVLSVSAREPMEALERYQLLQVAVLAGLVLLAFLWGFYVSSAATGQVKRMARRLQAPAAGDLKVRLEPKGYRGPFANLARTINGVLDQVQRRVPGVAESVLTRTDEQVASVLREPAPEESHPAPDDFPFGEPAGTPAPPLAEARPPAEEAPRGGFDPFGAGPEPAEESAWGREAPAAAPAEPETPWREDTRVTSPAELEALRAEAAPAPRREATDPFAAAMAEQGEEAPADEGGYNPDATVVAKVPEALLAATARSAARPSAPAPAQAPADPEEAHFQEVYRDFVAMRQRLGETAEGLTYDRFAAKLRKNRDAIRDKHGSRTVRFQVYEKGGKAALKATPVR